MNFIQALVALKDDFIPVGKCLLGSGDPYFLKIENGHWNIYRIPHDSIIEDSLDKKSIELVSTLLTLISKGS